MLFELRVTERNSERVPYSPTASRASGQPHINRIFEVMRFCLVFLVCCFGLIGCKSSQVEQRVAYRGKLEDFSGVQMMNMRQEQGWWIITARINGVGGEFLFDTGAMTAVTQEFATKANLNAIDTRDVQTPSGTRQIRYTQLERLQIGQLEYTGLDALILDTDESGLTCLWLEVDGIFGINAIQHTMWFMDYHFEDAKNVLGAKSYDLRREMQDSNRELPIYFDKKNRLMTRLTIEGQEQELMFDTGSNGGIQIRSLGREHSLPTLKGYGVVQRDVTGITIDTVLISKSENVQPPTGEMKKMPLLLVQNESMQPTLGTGFFDRTLWFLDIQGGYFSFFETKFGLDLALGASIDCDDESCYISFIVEGSAAHDAGLGIGDRILTLNGVSINPPSEARACELRQAISEKRIPSVTMDVMRGSDRRSLTIQKRPLFN